ncbi:hypothetical protein [Allohahella sp. A8]|uniref:hypothetical protein n=1 Tax=Allohahella sp. A8 TaxID=3141461 RepID=UPI003A811562
MKAISIDYAKPLSPAARDWTGEKFSFLEVVGYAGSTFEKTASGRTVGTVNTRRHFWTKCLRCGITKPKAANNLSEAKRLFVTSQTAASCGCFARANSRENKWTHGYARKKKRPLYYIWKNMRARCSNPKASKYENYGGRGISVCPEWAEFACFLKDVGDRPSPDMSLDRINNDGDYEPSNVRWATPSEQGCNKRTNRLVGGVTVAEFARKNNFTHSMVTYRLNNGWPEHALSLPPGSRNPEKGPKK